LGFKKLSFKINDRRALNELIVLSGFNIEKVPDICIILDKADKIGLDGVRKELLENGYDLSAVDNLIEKFDRIKQAKTNEERIERLSVFGVSEEVVDSLKTIIRTVQNFTYHKSGFGDYKVLYDPFIIRGQGYYTGTVFEVFDDDFGRAIGGGGRYDKMIEKFLGVSIPAVGCSIGLYVVAMLMVERKYLVPSNKLALVYDKKSSYEEIMDAKIKLMEKGYEVAIFAFPKNFNNFAEKLKANNYKMLVKMTNLDNIIEL
jgi:histidyl-tRNA synthetase